MKKNLLLLFLVFASVVSAQEATPTIENINSFEGKTITICEKVTGVHETKGENVILNFGKAYPNNAFSIIIFKRDREKFSYNPLEFLNEKTICITGTVIMYKGKPEIVIKYESEIVIK
ncbi:hypothetical protein [Flavobacterium terrigena]|uniref:Micrococcal nuclease n=1 Tax=Flavobacterium terrigena TaxID=402734 RepID=A0A1H6WI06_9FLAO|nr:hypothetical protein [Flavobacterium terrigena]SEJ12112.1 micrococcal nuclease [Flavobacterium terrigena]